MKYGIWITTQWWACIDGGDDETGTREEMETKAAEYTSEKYPGQIVEYEARPYVEIMATPVQVYEFTMRELLREREKNGKLSQEIEASYVSRLSDEWKQMTDEEQDAMEKMFSTPSGDPK